MLRFSYATHLLVKQVVYLRYIRKSPGHNSSETAGIYEHVFKGVDWENLMGF